MPKHIETGRKGELLAKKYLEEKGYLILHLNWRHSYYEIDLIASRNGVLHFIEIKTRRNDNFGMPEESVTTGKMKRLKCAADEFQFLYPDFEKVQYDVLSVRLGQNNQNEILLIEDVE
ncbi:MAG TPA: YraN family protein [Flavitalea sp.]|nr:YraN family protein [Flavitalea sp.]